MVGDSSYSSPQTNGGAEIEDKHCVPIHFAAGIWFAANRRKRAPPPSRFAAKQLEKAIRIAEFNNVQEILRQMGHLPTNNTEYELFSLRHDVCAGNHDRDYR